MGNLPDLGYRAANPGDLKKSQFILDRLKNKRHTLIELVKIVYEKRKWIRFVDNLKKDFTIAEFSTWDSYAFSKDNECALYWCIDDQKIEIEIYADGDQIQEVNDLLDSYKFIRFNNYIRWFYNNNGHSTNLPVHNYNLPIEEMYPFLAERGKTLEQYYNDFIDSSASVLLLIGPPGTGKTSFLKGLISHSNESACISYNVNLLNDDEIFMNFITGSAKFMIMEDCDLFLDSRDDGNTMMHRFLNISDGLVSLPNKKMIFTTNLPNTNNIDEALLRPGRCFDVLRFEQLTKQQADVLANKVGKTIETDYDNYTIAEVFSGGNRPTEEKAPTTQKLGFIK